MKARNLCFLLFVILSATVFWIPLTTLVNLSSHDEAYSYILLIPLISLFLIYLERRKVFLNVQHSVSVGPILLLIGITLYYAARRLSLQLSQNDNLSMVVFSAVVIWMAGFVLCYGVQAFRSAAFPLLFLFLMIPIPSFLLRELILALQKGSAATAYGLFRLAGVPVLREGFSFSLPGVDIEIAEQCGGIRSGLALFIASLVAAQLFLRSGWRRACLTAAIIPIVIFKNGVRIVTISLLAVYVDSSYLSGRLHRYGGIPFGLLAIAILAPLLRLLRKSEKRSSQKGPLEPTITLSVRKQPEPQMQ
jgi:exosortase